MRSKTLCITAVALAMPVQAAFKLLALFALLLSFIAAARADQFTFRTIDFPGVDSTWGLAIGPRGEIGGLACVGPSCQGFLLRNGADPVIITPPGASSSYVTGIQPGGFLLAGQYNDASGNAHGYVLNRLRPGAFTPIDPDPNGVLFTEVADMNPSGDLAGWYADLAGIGHGYVVLKGSLTSFDIPGATFSAAFGISPGGDLVGTYCDAAGCHAYLLRGGISGALTTIDVPDAAVTDAFGVNSLGQIVGDYCMVDGTCHGYLRNPDGGLITVDPPGSSFVIAFAINPAGQITGLSCDDSGCHAFLATPQLEPAFQTTTVPTRASGRPPSSSTLDSVRRLRPLGKGGLARLGSKH